MHRSEKYTSLTMAIVLSGITPLLFLYVHIPSLPVHHDLVAASDPGGRYLCNHTTLKGCGSSARSNRSGYTPP